MINMHKWAEQITATSRRIAIPVMTHPGIEACNYKVIDAVTNGQVHYEAIKALIEKYPSAASTVIMDLTVEAEAFGASVHFPENEIPTVIGELVRDLNSVDQLNIPGLQQGRIPEYLKANRLAAQHIVDKPVFGGCIGPYSLAGRLMGMTELMTAIYLEPDTVMLLLEKCTQFIHKYCKAIKETGVSGIIIAEPAAGLLSNEDCLQYSSIYIRRVVEALQDNYFMIILHNCGNTGHCTPAMLATGAAGLHFGNRIAMSHALKECPQNILVMGNIDPVSELKMLDPDRLSEKIESLLQETGGYRNFVLSTGCDVPPHVPEANIRAFFNALEKYNNQLT